MKHYKWMPTIIVANLLVLIFALECRVEGRGSILGAPEPGVVEVGEANGASETATTAQDSAVVEENADVAEEGSTAEGEESDGKSGEDNSALAGDEAGPVTEDANAEDEEEPPVALQEMPHVRDTEKSLLWSPPKYAEQKQALGYTGTETFAVPKGMEERVAFWLKIYTEYTTQEGLLHDSKYINNIFEEVSFLEIENDAKLTARQKSKRKSELVKNAKRRIRDRLLSLERVKDPRQLTGEDLRYYKMYEADKSRHKYREASQKGRLRFQLGQKDRFVEGIFASGRYLPKIEEIFRERNLPLELTRLPFVESSFNIFAYSKVGASGIWQIMRYTARPYMRVNYMVDERNDPIKASQVAARILESNYRMLGSWPLALTGYNHGPSGVSRLVKKLQTTDLTAIIERARKSRFGFASENFYASFLAALEAERNAEKYYGKVRTSQPLHAFDVVLEQRLEYRHLQEWFGGDQDLARLYNPHLLASVRQGHSPIPRKTTVRVLKEKSALVTAFLNEPRREPADRGGRYRVQRGDTLSTIARRHGVTTTALVEANNLRSRHTLQIGQELLIPARP